MGIENMVVKYQEFMQILNNLKKCNSSEQKLWSFIEKLMSDLESSKKQNLNLEKQLQSIIIREKSVSSKYFIILEEQATQLKKENSDLEEKIKSQQKAFMNEKLDIEQKYELKLKYLNEELMIMNQKLKQKENDFFDELQMAQANSTSKFEKIEQKLNWQLGEANKQLKEAHIINTKLYNHLQYMEQQTKFYQNDQFTSTAMNISNLNANISSKGSINVVSTVKESLNDENRLSTEEHSSNSTPLFRGQNSCSKRASTFVVPPLKPCSDSKRKRKLHDPEDVSYLENMLPNEPC